MDWRKHITVDPSVCHGTACVKGTRIMVSVVLDNIAAGMTEQDILVSYPALSAESVKACMLYAAELARERIVALPAA